MDRTEQSLPKWNAEVVHYSLQPAATVKTDKTADKTREIADKICISTDT
jgi:hypothetical protein